MRRADFSALGGFDEYYQPVYAEEVPGHEQGPRSAAADHVQCLGSGEPRAHRDQRRATETGGGSAGFQPPGEPMITCGFDLS